jgi:hypothetical protein
MAPKRCGVLDVLRRVALRKLEEEKMYEKAFFDNGHIDAGYRILPRRHHSECDNNRHDYYAGLYQCRYCGISFAGDC